LLVNKEGKLFVQGWAIVENTSNEDWKDVKLSLVSGRPISFQMDLYQPLYVNRPMVQPEQIASITPQTHASPTTGAFGVALNALANQQATSLDGSPAAKACSPSGATSAIPTPQKMPGGGAVPCATGGTQYFYATNSVQQGASSQDRVIRRSVAADA